MKKEKVTNLIREYLELRKRIESLQEELRGLQKELREIREIRNSFRKNSDLAVLLDKEGSLLEELMGLRRRMERVEGSLFSCRSRDFIRWVISCVLDLRPEYGKDEHYHNLLTSLVSIVIHFEEYEEERKSYALRELLHLQNQKVE